MPVTKLALTPGVNREGTSYSNENGYYACDKVRFKFGFPESIGGWVPYAQNTFYGSTKLLFAYTTTDATRLLAIGTHLKFYIEKGQGFNDVTPARPYTYDATLTNPLATTDTSSLITVTDTAHGCQTGDLVYIAGASAIGGIPADAINGRHVVTYVTADSYTIDTGVTATSTVASGGGSVTFSYGIHKKSLSSAFTTDTGTPGVIYVNDATHGARTGDFVTISGVASAVNGVPETEINGEHQITIVDNTQYFFSIDTAPTSSGTTGTALVEYQINTGDPYYTFGNGWGSGLWSRSTWGSGFSDVVVNQLRLWSASNYGNDLIFGRRDGNLYYWTYPGINTTFARAQAIKYMPNANYVPESQTYTLVTSQRFVVTLGSNDYLGTDPIPMLVRWSDQENYLEWEPKATTQAGSQILTSGSKLITAKETKQEILVWSDAALYSMQFQGPPFIFGFQTLAENISIVGPNAAIIVNGTAYWMGREKFYVYDGRVQALPSSLRSFVFSDFNESQAWQVVAGANEAFNEVWWYYPSNGSVLLDRYVLFNYAEGTWSYGTLRRSCWLDSGLLSSPIATTYDFNTQMGRLYSHEVGCDDGETNPPSPIHAYIETADFDIDDGHNFGFVTRLIPDLTFEGSTGPSPSITLTVKPRRFSGANYSQGDTPGVTRVTTVPVEQYTEQVFVRARGRQMALRVDSNTAGTRWRMGAMRMDIKPDGRK